MLDVKVDRDDPTLLHDQVAAQIRRAIADGEAKITFEPEGLHIELPVTRQRWDPVGVAIAFVGAGSEQHAEDPGSQEILFGASKRHVNP